MTQYGRLTYRSQYAGELDFGAKARVALGVELLNERVDGWLDRIDLDRLDLASSEDCVVGQLHPSGNFDAAVPGWLGPSKAYAADVGFFAGPVTQPSTRDEYEALNAEWRRAVTKLRATA